MGAGRVGVVYNPTKFADPELLINAVRRRAEAADAVVSWHATTAADPGGGQVQAALDAGCELVIACGGDGTISACAATLAGTQTRFALVPAGTGNLLARNLDVPMELRDALDVAFAGSVRRIDVLHSETRRFVVMAGLGLDAALIRDTSDALKSRIGWLAYLGGLATAIRRTPRARFTVTIDDCAPVTRTGVGVVVGNVGNLQGGVALLTAASHDDGALDVIVFAPHRARDWLILAARIALRRLHVSSHAAVHQGKRVVITTDRPVPIEYDGEFAGYTERLAVCVMPGALTVCSPPARVQGGVRPTVSKAVRSTNTAASGFGDPGATSSSTSSSPSSSPSSAYTHDRHAPQPGHPPAGCRSPSWRTGLARSRGSHAGC